MPSLVRKRPRAKRPRGDGQELRVRYSPAVALAICERIAAGTAWAHICNTGRFPAVSTLYRWRDRHPVFAEALAQAREAAAEGPGAPRPIIFDKLETQDMSEKPSRGRRRAPPKKKTPDRNGMVLTVRYSKRTTRLICERLAAGEIWSQICNQPKMPSYGTLAYWRKKHPEFDAAVAEARLLAGEARFETALEVAMAATPATVQADKLKVGTLLHHAERLDPKFGPRRVRGGDEGAGDEVRRIIIRRFERAVDDQGRSYIRAIDSVQEVE